MKLKARIKLGQNGNGKNGHSLNGNGSGDRVLQERKVKPNAKTGTLKGYAEEMIRRIGPIRCDGDIWYRYKGGVWQQVEEPKHFERIAWLMQNDPPKVEAARKILEAVRMQTQLVDGEQMYGAIRHVPGEEFYLINCKNCIIKVSLVDGSLDTMPHDEKWMFAGQIASNFLEKARCPKFLEVLKKVLPAEANRVLLLDFTASCLLPDSRFQCMLFCTGSGGNGKSTVWEAIARAFGQDLVARINYHDICANNKKYIWRLNRMVLNLGTETQAKPIDENAVIKAIVCGEAFDSDRIYKESFRMRTTAKLAFLTNHPLRYEQASDADYRRTRIIHFGETFIGNERASIELERSLGAEVDGILSMIVRRIARVSQKAKLSFGDEVSLSAYQMFKTSNNPCLEFDKQCLRKLPGCHLEREVCWKTYQNYARLFHYRPYSREAFFKKLYQINPGYISLDGTKRPRKVINGKQVEVIPGCQLTSYGEEVSRMELPIS